MSNQPQAHVADERAAFEQEMLRLDIIGDEGFDRRATGEYVDDTTEAAWESWQAARAAIPAGADENELREHLARVFDAEPLERLSGYEVAGRIRAAMTCRIAAGAPAETPKPLTVQRITDIWNETEKEWFTSVKVALDPADAGNLTVHFVRAIERALAAQPAPAPATDARDGERLDLIETLVKENGYCYIHQNRSRYGLIGLGLLGETLRESLDALALRRAAMLSANSPREAG